MIIVSFYTIFSPINAKGWFSVSTNISDFFIFSDHHPSYPNFSLWSFSFNLLWLTIKYTILGTLIGSFFAFWTSLFSSNFITNKYSKKIINFLIIFFKSFPIPFILLAISDIFSKQLAAVLIIFWFTWLWLHRYFLSFLNSIDWYNYHLQNQISKNKFVNFKNLILPIISNKFLGLFFYSLESNIRWTTIISAAGVIGIGKLIIDAQDPTIGWSVIGIPLIVLIFSIIILELIVIVLNKLTVNKKNVDLKQKNNFVLFWKLNYDKFAKLFILIIILMIAIWSIINIPIWSVNTSKIKFFLKNIFNINWSLFTQNSDYNPIFMVWSLIAQMIVALTILFVFTILNVLLSNEKLNKPYQWIPGKIILIIFRIIPSTIFLFMLLPLSYIPPLLLTAILIGFKDSLELTKKINETLNSIDWKKYELLKLQGWSKFKIIKDFVFPSIWPEYKNYLFVYSTNILHSLILFGYFSGSQLGQKISVSSSNFLTNSVNNFFTYAWVGWFVIFTLEILVLASQDKWWKFLKIKFKNSFII